MLKFKNVICSSLLYLSASVLVVNANTANDWDMDNSGDVDALTDGLLMLRYSFGLRGETLTNGAISADSSLTTAEVEAEISNTQNISDIDGDGSVDALTDGLLLLRYLFGLSGDALISGAVSSEAARSSVSDISQYIDSYMLSDTIVDSDNDGVADANDAFPEDPNEIVDSDNDGVGDNADYAPNDPTIQSAPGSTATYCATQVTHFNIENHPGSILLSVQNSGANSVTVTATSVDDVIDVLMLQSVEAGGTASAANIVNGVATSTITWVDSMPATTTFRVLWSDEAQDGNQMLNPENGDDGLGYIDTSNTCANPHPTPGGGTVTPLDSDNDGVIDDNDAFPNDPSETLDSDGDGVGNNADAFPTDASETLDSDNDGVGNNADAFPNDPNETLDVNNNGIGDNADANANNSGPQSNYCEKPVYHFNIDGHGGSGLLTIENSGSDSLTITMASNENAAIDVFLIYNDAGANVAPSTFSNGIAQSVLSWPSGAMPSAVTLTILWSDDVSGGNVQLNPDDIGSIDTSAVCSGNSNGSNNSNNNGSSDSAPTPSEAPSDVLSIFSDSYTDISGVNYNPAWGQSTSVTNADGVLSYQNLNYQGTTFGSAKDVSGYSYFHIDILPEAAGSIQLFLINSGAITGGQAVETSFNLTLSANQWNSFDIPLSSFSAVVDLTQVDEIKIVGTGNIVLDNLYFAGASGSDNNSGNDGDGQNGGNVVVATEEISVANGVLVGGVNSSKPQYVVYTFDNDTISSETSACYGGCANAWPPVLVTDGVASGISNLDSFARADGALQVTYEGRPLYFYAGDQEPGDRSGDSVSGWHLVEYGNIGQVNKLFNDSTELEPVTTFTRDNGVIVTRIADRGRDRHAKDSNDQDHYDHYLAHYWQYRTMRIQLEDYVVADNSVKESKISVTWITEAALGAKEFRVWYSGTPVTGQFWFNPQPVGAQANPNEPGVHYHGSGLWDDDFNKISSQGGQHKYTLDITTRWQLGGQIQEALQPGWNMEFEASMFLANPPAGSRLNYYGTSFVYKIGQPGVHPFEWVPGQQDGTPIPPKGLSGGGTTLGYNYTNEPAGRFMQMATNMAPGNAESFVLGRRVHHTSFLNGIHGERHDNPVWHEQADKSGTHYINESCAGCHVRNGRALVADVGGSLDKWVFKVGDQNGNPLSSIGSVLQPEKNGSGSSEGSVTLGAWSIMGQDDFDGDFVGLRKPNYQFSNVSPPQFSARIAPSLVGMGLLEAIDESTIISWADPEDSDNDGISGHPSIVEDPVSGVMRLGRFGYKAGTFSVKHQVASAFNTDMGVMTSMIPEPDCGSQQTNCGNSGAEISDEHVDNLVKYVSLLGVGARRDYNNQTGESLFQEIGCADCHRPSMVTSNYHPLAELRGQTIYPYTDLLLHDMGPGLADSLGEGSASGSEWRTAPLWGLGLTKNVMLGDAKGNDLVSYARDYPDDLNRIGYLHDGRARTIDEAIRWHGGEAENSRRLYSGEQVGNKNGLTSSQRASVLEFLESL